LTSPTAGTDRDQQHATAGPASPGQAEILAYYFPQWHRDPRNDEMIGEAWTEWDVVRSATPRFPGHYQPRVPAWGETDESDPACASRIVEAALDHGISGFVVDWYWYDNQPFLNGFLDRGLLNAGRLGEFRFALMWANHDWTDLYPAAHPGPATLLPAPNTRYHAERAFAHVAERYLSHPSYWKPDGVPYFSIYNLPDLIRGLGGLSETRALLDAFRRRAERDGLGGLHLNGVVNSSIDDPPSVLKALGCDSATHYTWWHHSGARFSHPATSYRTAMEDARRTWAQMTAELPCPYLPNVTVGWDPSPRTVEWEMDSEAGYPFTTVFADTTPDVYREALTEALELARRSARPPAVLINAWNEWSEGSYLEPDQRYGFGYLEATAAALAAHRHQTRG
jgi:hypothetical protein